MDIFNLFKPKKEEKHIEKLLKSMKNEIDLDVRFKIAKTIATIQDQQAVDVLVETVQNDDRNIRLVSIVALGNMRDRRIVDPLIKALKDEHF